MKTIGLFGILVFGLTACVPVSGTDFPVTEAGQAAVEVQNVDIVKLIPQNIGAYGKPESRGYGTSRLPTATGDWRYLVGVGDVLGITVWDHPELTLPAGAQRSQVESGSPVKADGSIFYPYIGNVQVAGRSVGQIQQELSTRLAEYIPDPQIEVKVAAFNSQKVLVTGAVVRPGAQKITNIPLTLIEAVTASGGLLPEADSGQVRIKRDGKTYTVNLEALLRGGSGRNNPVLQGGDIVNIPLRQNNAAYVLGQVQQPGAIDLGAGGINLTEALSQRGGLDEASANAQGIFVFRAIGNGKFRVFQLDATTPLAFVLATKFTLHPQDVVYVTADPAAQWNAVITALLPSITAIRGVQSIGGSL